MVLSPAGTGYHGPKDYKPADPNCGWCLGKGVVDSGGVTPWGWPIDIRCGCTYPEIKEENANTVR